MQSRAGAPEARERRSPRGRQSSQPDQTHRTSNRRAAGKGGRRSDQVRAQIYACRLLGAGVGSGPETVTAGKLEATAIIINKKGLHARASAKFVETVARFQADVTVRKGETAVSGRSIMGLMMLGASLGSSIELEAEGPDAGAVLDALRQLISARFNEDS
ncbi:MAG: HPr family phosphocarrier protein [Alphaproteobacteria bacterium]|nr:HPr family phosphocarrier protein [Alphaproteobacteria bacterium]